MLSPAIGCAVVAAVLASVFICARVLVRSGRVSSEASRKIVHIGMGAVCMSFPWLFSSTEPVIWLALGTTIVLLVTRLAPRLREEFGCVIHGIARESYGEFAFIAGVAGAF